MSEILIKSKTFEEVKKYNEDTSKVTYKGKEYFLYKFSPKSEEFYNTLYVLKRIATCGILSPKVKIVDKKNGFILTNFIHGTTIADLLFKEDLKEDIYKKIFTQAWLIKSSRSIVDFHPDKWILNNKNDLIYVGNKFESYKEENDFANNGVRLWFFTRDYVEYARTLGLEPDKSRLKESYVINKEIVLVACKYYR